VGKGEISESLLVPLVNQFGLMQQNMLDQFQQTISMLVEMFGNLQREQMDTIREELDQIQSLTKEFHALKSKLAERPAEEAGSIPAPSAPAPRPGMTEAEGVLLPKEDQERAIKTALGPATAPYHPDAGPTPPALSPAEDPGASMAHDSVAAPSLVQGSGEVSAHECSGVASASPQPSTGGSPRESDRDMIIWLHQRMMVLQEERESRWQKILKLLPGLS
jgi:hypothetical protein